MFGSRHEAFPVVYFSRPGGLAGITLDRQMSLIGPTITRHAGSPADALAAQAKSPVPVIYHLTGEEDALGDAGGGAQALLDALDDLRVAGGHVIWSRISVPETEAAEHVANELWSVASRVHVPSFAAVEDLRAHGGRFDLPLVTVVPECNFLGHYPSVAMAHARQTLEVDDGAHAFLVFDDGSAALDLSAVIATFTDIEDPDLRLLVTGSSQSEDPRVLSVDIETPKALATAFAAADTVLLPYASAISAPAGRLAASFARGILGTDVAALRDLVRHEWSGRLYGLAEEDGLARAFRVAANEGRPAWQARGQTAARIAEARDGALIANQWRDLYLSLALRPRARVVDGTRIEII